MGQRTKAMEEYNNAVERLRDFEYPMLQGQCSPRFHTHIMLTLI